MNGCLAREDLFPYELEGVYRMPAGKLFGHFNDDRWLNLAEIYTQRFARCSIVDQGLLLNCPTTNSYHRISVYMNSCKSQSSTPFPSCFSLLKPRNLAGWTDHHDPPPSFYMLGLTHLNTVIPFFGPILFKIAELHVTLSPFLAVNDESKLL